MIYTLTETEQLRKKLIECRSSVKNDCNEYDRFILRKEPHCNDVDYQEQKRLHDLLDYIDGLDGPLPDNAAAVPPKVGHERPVLPNKTNLE